MNGTFGRFVKRKFCELYIIDTMSIYCVNLCLSIRSTVRRGNWIKCSAAMAGSIRLEMFYSRPRGKRIVLGQYIAEGGEGSVFAVHLPSEATLIAKLYHPAQRMRWREQKLRLMCSRPIRSPCVAWPREILYDELRCFVGVLMPRAHGVPPGAFAFHGELMMNQSSPHGPVTI